MGAEYQWNGSGYQLVKEAPEVSFGQMAMTALMGTAIAGPLSGVIGAATGLSGAALSAATASVISTGSQLALTGEVDFEQALVAAATAGLGTAVGDAISAAPELDALTPQSASEWVDYYESVGMSAETISEMRDVLTQAETAGSAVNSVVDVLGTVSQIANGVQGIDSDSAGTDPVYDVGQSTTPEMEVDENGNFVYDPDNLQVVIGDYVTGYENAQSAADQAVDDLDANANELSNGAEDLLADNLEDNQIDDQASEDEA